MADIQSNENYSEETNFHPGQSPQGGQSSTNSHPHDSEYDTASELEGDDYDEDDNSLGIEEEDELDESDDNENEDDDPEFDSERQRGDGQEQNEYSKKVDEDRSNPQYIPKRGTFYEHDDRTTDEPEQNVVKGEEGADVDTQNPQVPVTSLASKTMKKWQPASAIDRWSHDRYNENEQAPKSRAELVSAYGYDIRSEDGPPRAHRRRRYARGPSKYVRNWEDESAYIKSNSVSQRKPRPEDFPALGDRGKKNRKSNSYREEKENRYDRHNEKSGGISSNAGVRNYRSRKDKDRNNKDNKIDRRTNTARGKSFRQGIEFKNQNKNKLINEHRNSYNREKDESGTFNNDDRKLPQVETVSFTNTKANNNSNSYNSNNNNNKFNGHDINISKTQQIQPTKDKISSIASSTIIPNNNRQTQQPQQQQIQSKLQQMQSRNEATGSGIVGNVQKHSLTTQNQNAVGELPQNPADTGRTAKRYSSLRQRSQAESTIQSQTTQQTQLDHHSLQQMQQLHDHHQQTQNQNQPQHVLLPDQHIIQANLMQLYHSQQENIQAQMQGVAIQSIPTVPGVQTHQTKTQYQNVQQQYQSPSQNAPPTYYAPTNEYTPSASPQAIQQQFAQQQQTTYIQQQPTASQLAAYNPQTQSTPPPSGQQMPPSLNYVQTSATSNPSAPSYQNYSNFQNYNTVGGTTYFVPHQQPQSRSVVPPQRRPTNAIPILAPPNNEKSKKQFDKDDDNKCNSITSNAPVGSAENIDHILDNMFVQRPPFQPPTRKSSSPAAEITGTTLQIQPNINLSGNEDNSVEQNQQLPQHSQQVSSPISSSGGGGANSSGNNNPIICGSDTSQLDESFKQISLNDEKDKQEQVTTSVDNPSSTSSLTEKQIVSTNSNETG